MPYEVSNSFKRGMLRTYTSRRPLSHIYNMAGIEQVTRMKESGEIYIERIDGMGNKYTDADNTQDETELPTPTATPTSVETERNVDNTTPKATTRQTEPPAPSSPLSVLSANDSESGRVFSDRGAKAAGSDSQTPPSSPVLPSHKERKSAFSLLKRKRSDETDETKNESVRDAKVNGQVQKKQKLTQMTLDLGNDTRKKCKGCGMEYVVSSKEDTQLHKEFHTMNINGVEMGKRFVAEARVVGRIKALEGEKIVIVDESSADFLQKRAMRVLSVVKDDLGSLDIDAEQLWKGLVESSIKPSDKKRRGPNPAPEPVKDVRYKVFCYLSGEKCVGLCLAERIKTAYKVLPDTASVTGESVQTSSSIKYDDTTPSAVLLGISRIWTARSHRRKGIATALLDTARLNFFYGIEVPKTMVAFSQPSESGGVLARKWYGGIDGSDGADKGGWHVYSD